jgi:hypothetical protein
MRETAGIFLASILLKEMRYLVYIRYLCSLPLWMLQKIPEMLSLIEQQKYKRFLGEDSRPSYFPHKSLTCWGNGKEGKIGASKAPQKRLEWENLIFFAASNAGLLYIEYP